MSSVLFYSFAIASLTRGWVAFVLFSLQIYYMDENVDIDINKLNINIASKLKSLFCFTSRSGTYDVTFTDLRSDPRPDLRSFLKAFF